MGSWLVPGMHFLVEQTLNSMRKLVGYIHATIAPLDICCHISHYCTSRGPLLDKTW